jgi:hypothetical protein
MARSGWVSWVLAGVGFLVLSASCSEANDAAPVAEVGGEPGAAGAAAAGSANASAGDTSSGAGAPALPGRPDGLPWLGAACRTADDCGKQGLRCLSRDEDFMDGETVPPGGLCTTDCKTDDDCRAFDPGAVCATFAEAPLVLAYAAKTVQRWCVQGCTLGPPSGPTKCHGRADFACRPFAPDHPATCLLEGEVCPTGTFCYRGACREQGCGPRCNADRDCGGGQHCDPFTGLCDVDAAATVPVGADCSDDADATSCGGGNCLVVSDKGVTLKSVCTQSCTIGQLCADGAGACVWPRFEHFALGDIGYCVQRCDCDSDCVNPVDRCVPWGDPETEKAYGSLGACDIPPPGAVTLTCDGGAAGAAGNSAGANAGGAGG